MTAKPARALSRGYDDRCGLVSCLSETLLPARLADVGAVPYPGQLSQAAVGTSPVQVGRALGWPRSSCRGQVTQSLLSPRDEAPSLRIVSFASNHEVPGHEVVQQRVECLDRDLLFSHGVPLFPPAKLFVQYAARDRSITVRLRLLDAIWPARTDRRGSCPIVPPWQPCRSFVASRANFEALLTGGATGRHDQTVHRPWNWSNRRSQ